jgi:hypothetical protein
VQDAQPEAEEALGAEQHCALESKIFLELCVHVTAFPQLLTVTEPTA